MNLDISLSTHLTQLGQQLFDDAKTQAENLSNTEDTEALHDFRVSLRRLRSFLKSFEDYLKNARKLRGKLSDIMDLTNAGRDAEVHRAWLKARQDKAGDIERVGLEYLLEHLNSNEHVEVEKVSKAFTNATKKLGKTFSDDKNIKTKGDATFGAVSAGVLKDYSEELQKLLQTIESSEDEAIHEARIVGKRLRYTLELLGTEAARTLVKQLKKFQDTTGDLHDLQVLEPKVDTFLYAETLLWSQALRNGAKTNPQHELSNLPELQRSYGLAQVAHTLALEKAALYQELENNWLGEAAEMFFSDVLLFIQQLGSEEASATPKEKLTTKPAKTKKVRKLAEAA
jgi:CHAD domain-containing protein